MSPQRPVIAVDVGGTFTDCVAWRPGRLDVAKVATTPDQSDGVIEGSSRLAAGERAAALLHGSTIATNALLERRGADTVLVTDPGFEDVIEIGRQDRPSLYDPFSDRPIPLVSRSDRWESREPAAIAEQVRRRRPEAVAVCLAYSFLDTETERTLGEALEAEGVTVSLSHRVAPEFREFERASTTVLNAYLQPGVGSYLDRLADRVSSVAGRLEVMRSSGGLMRAGEAAQLAAALLLSGPAGGVVAASEMGRARGYRRLITFDMGGTSTDVCRIEEGRPELTYERTVEGYLCRMPSVAVHTVGAGGGSIGWVDPGGSLRVGPQSAGSVPGPASYGVGGTDATVTDAHLLLARIDPDVRLGGRMALDGERALRAITALAESLGLDAVATAAGIIEVVEAHMERAIRRVSVEQGADPREATLVAFGGAGGLHATTLARRLGMQAVAVPPYGGVFSALGLLMAPPRLDVARSSVGAESESFGAISDGVARQAGEWYTSQHGTTPTTVTRSVDMRYRGQAHEISVPLEAGDTESEATARFHRLHHEANGFSRPDDGTEAVTFRAVAQGEAMLGWSDLPELAPGPLPARRRRRVIMGGEETEVDVWWRPDLPGEAQIAGPAVVEEEVGTTVLEPGDRATVAADGTLEVTW